MSWLFVCSSSSTEFPREDARFVTSHCPRTMSATIPCTKPPSGHSMRPDGRHAVGRKLVHCPNTSEQSRNARVCVLITNDMSILVITPMHATHHRLSTSLHDTDSTSDIV